MLLLCRVTLGKPVEQFSSTRIAHAPPGHHSVIGRPSVGGLAYPEYVIYRGEQVWSESHPLIITPPLLHVMCTKSNSLLCFVRYIFLCTVLVVMSFPTGLSWIPHHISHCPSQRIRPHWSSVVLFSMLAASYVTVCLSSSIFVCTVVPSINPIIVLGSHCVKLTCK